jgi:hypothetical protein
VIDACAGIEQLAASVMVKSYVPALNPKKSKSPPSAIPVCSDPVSSSEILYGAVPPVIVPVMFPSVSPKQESSSPEGVLINSAGVSIVSSTVVVQSLASVMVKVYVSALNPEKSKLPPSAIPVQFLCHQVKYYMVRFLQIYFL